MVRKIFFYSILVFVLVRSLYSQPSDTTIVGPGVIHYQEYREQGPWNFNILEIDLTNPWIRTETVKANDYLFAHERTSSMSLRKDFEGHRVVGAVNGDFYDGNGVPIGTQIVNGEILKSDNNWQNIAFNSANECMIENVYFTGRVFKYTDNYPINGVNKDRQTDNLILYNSFFGTSTQTNSYGTELRVFPADDWMVNDTLLLIVEDKKLNQGNIPIGNGKGILSGHGLASDFLNGFSIGDTIKTIIEVHPGLPRLVQLIGGNTKLVANGVAVGSTGDRHPRTAAGFSADSTKLYLITVDGRQPGFSIGMSLRELSEYMLEWGIYQGINLDGGGSTTMIVRNEVINSPSDPGGERSVANALMIISEAPTGSLTHLRISPKRTFAVNGSTVNFTVKGFDEYYNPLGLNPGSIDWSCDPWLGTITGSGVFFASNDTSNGFVYVEVEGIRDSAYVVKTTIVNIALTPSPVILQIGEHQQMTAEAIDSYNNIISLNNNSYSWSVSGNVGSITASGYFSALSYGTGTIIAEYNSVLGSAPVTVGQSTSIIIDDFSSVSNYSLSGVLVNLAQCSLTLENALFVSEPASGKLEYSLATGGTSALYMNCSIPISGTPDKVGIYIYGDGKGHWLRGEFEDSDAEKFLVNFTESSPGINWTNTWQYIEISLEDAIPSWSNPAALLDFPITWKRIYLAETDDSKKDQGVIYFDNFQIDFISRIKEDQANGLSSFRLEQNYPNPFNPTTKISFIIPDLGTGSINPEQFVTLTIFDILGRQIARLVNGSLSPGRYEIEFNAANLPSGVYFYRLETGELSDMRKMVLLR